LSALAAIRPEPTMPDQRPSITQAGRIAKRTVDICGSAILLFLSAPLIFILAARIKLHDGGPVLFRRRVVGIEGEFDAFKLRTMRLDADEVLRRDAKLRERFEINFKLRDDPRVTAIGAMLRKSGLDELPQLWNVLKGEMSLVGPRMITPAELKKYEEAGWIFGCMKPGLTGYWQVRGGQDEGYGNRVEMDLFYVENWSLWFDLKILMATPLRMLHRAKN
jgi:lipopolysaccharide/colanic/teichoic acid biosynthesis glycosyltransferase